MNILIIDDDPGTCDTLSAGLRRLGGHEVATALTGREGLALAAVHIYDAVLLDLKLPDTNDLDVLTALRHTKAAGAATYVMTGFGSVATAVEAMRLGATDYLPKPLDIDALLRVFSPEPPSPSIQAPPIDGRIATVMAMIAGDPAIRMEALAAAVDLGASRLRHLFRAAAGVSLARFLRNARLDEAAVLLRTTRRRISDIASSVGFSEMTHFDRCFHRRFGVSPTAYRLANPAKQ